MNAFTKLIAASLVGLTIGMATTPAPAAEAFYKASNIAKFCEHKPASALAAVTGIFDALSFTGFTKGRVCLPEGVTNGQLQKVVCKYIEDTPSELHQSSAWVTMSALADAFPCQ